MTRSEPRSGRQRLIDAALELFSEQGYEATSIADIAKRSAVSRGSVPWHFGNKAGLLAAVVDQEIDKVVDSFDERATDAEGAVAALTAFTKQSSTGLFVTLLADSMRPDSATHHLHADLHRRIHAAVTLWLDRVAPGEPATGTRDQRATLALATVIGLQQQWRIAPDRIDVAGTYRLLVSTLLGAGEQQPPSLPEAPPSPPGR